MVTLLTTLIILAEKFTEGAFVVIIIIPIFIIGQLKIKAHYDKIAAGLSVSNLKLNQVNFRIKYDHIIIVPIASLNKAAIGALQYAQSLGGKVIALNISTDKEAMEKLKHKWNELNLNTGMNLISRYSPYRAVVTPLLDYIYKIADESGEDEKITVIVPQFMTHEPWGGLLHNHTGLFIRESLLKKGSIIVATYPYNLDSGEYEE